MSGFSKKAGMLIVLSLYTVSLALPMFVVPKVAAANFGMRTGYYLGTGASKTISGLGFQPDLVIITPSAATGASVFKTGVMPANTTSYFSATADDTGTNIAFTTDGFTIGGLAVLNTNNVLYRWMAFSGSDCTATGYLCVGTYTGNGAASRTITTGFQPDMIQVKRSTAVAAHFRTASMAANRTEFFTSTAANTAGAYIASSVATGFNVGTTDNATGAIYYYLVFRAGAGSFAQGSYTGNATAGTNRTGLGFQPDGVVIKNSTNATANNRRSIIYTDRHFGDLASYISNSVVDATGMVQGMVSDGFTVGAGNNTNATGDTFYWFAFGGAQAFGNVSGSFTMAQGTYTGNGAARSLTGTGFAPDLVLIKDNAANHAVFRIRQMSGNATAYLGAATADFTGGITSLDSNGFSLGTSTVVNTNGNTYHWQAFGNAYDSDTNSGSADFATGVYYGNGLTARPIPDIPFQPDLVTIKRNNTTAGTFRTSAYAGDLSSFFAATAETAGVIQSLNTSGFTVGTNAASNTRASLYRWFAFKSGTNFSVGTYTGTGVAGRQVSAPFWSDLIWVKRSTAVAGAQLPSTLTGGNAQYLVNTANAANMITGINASGFTVGTSTSTNTNGGAYRYAVWRVPPTGVLTVDIVDSGGVSVVSPSVGFANQGLIFNCTESTAALGVAAQKIRVSNMTANASWVLSVAPTAGPTGLWDNTGATAHYDFNDTTGTQAGCADGADTDTYAGKLRVEPSAGSITPQVGCSITNVTKGIDENYVEGSVDSVNLLTAAVGSNTECYWDVTGVPLRQTIPAEQMPSSYSLGLTLTILAQ